MPCLLHAGRAVDFGGFVELRVYAADGGKVDNGVEAPKPPDIDGQHNPRPVARLHVKPYTFARYAVYEVCDRTRLKGQHPRNEDADNNRGDKIRQKTDGLRQPFVERAAYLVEAQRQCQRENRAYGNEQEVHKQRIAHCGQGRRVSPEKQLKVPVPRVGPWASENPHREVRHPLERQNQPAHGHVSESEQQRHAGQSHGIKLPIAENTPYLFPVKLIRHKRPIPRKTPLIKRVRHYGSSSNHRYEVGEP